MLVLSRHRDEKIMLGDDIVVMVVDIRGDKVRLGFEAPRGTLIYRQEVYDAIHGNGPPIVAEASTDVKPKTLADFVQKVTSAE